MSTAAKRNPGTQPVVYDLGLLFPVLLLVGMGIVMVYSASSALALKKFGSDYFYLKKQAMFSLAFINASSDTSLSTTSSPAWAHTWAMPLPINPLPTTKTFRTSMFSLLCTVEHGFIPPME